MKKYHYLYLVHDGAYMNTEKGNLDFKKLGITDDLNRRLSQYNTNCIRPIRYLKNYRCESKSLATKIEADLKRALKGYLLDNATGFEVSHKTEVFEYNNKSKRIFNRIINDATGKKFKKIQIYANPYVGNQKNKKFNAAEYKSKVKEISKKYLSYGITEQEILDIITNKLNSKKESVITGSYEKHHKRPSKELIKLGSKTLWYTTQGKYIQYYNKYYDIQTYLKNWEKREANKLDYPYEISLIIDNLLKKGMKENSIVDLVKDYHVAYELSDDISDWQKPKIEGSKVERRGVELSLSTSFNNVILYWETKSSPVTRWKRYLKLKEELENIE